MSESDDVHLKKISQRKRIGKFGLVIGLCLICSVIILGLLTSFVSAYDPSADLVHVYNTIAVPVFVFGFLLLVSGLIAILVPEGLSQDGTWSLQTGPFR